MSNELEKVVNLPITVELADHYKMPAQSFLATVKSVAMPPNITIGQMIACLAVAREHGLNPLTREIFFMQTKGGQIQPVVSVDGWIRKINEHPEFNGLEFETAGSGDDLEMTCRIHRKDRAYPIAVTEYLAECKQGGPVWKTHPRRMLRNRVLCQCARVAFGFAGLMEPDEFQQWQSNPEIDGGGLVIEEYSARDGGPLPRSSRDRPAANAFQQLGGQEKYNALTADIEACQTVDDLHKCFDAFERDGVPWYEYPYGWARLLQDAYHYKLKDLNNGQVVEAEFEENGGGDPDLADLIESRIEQADGLAALDEIFEECRGDDGNEWGQIAEHQREDIDALYHATRISFLDQQGAK